MRVANNLYDVFERLPLTKYSQWFASVAARLQFEFNDVVTMLAADRLAILGILATARPTFVKHCPVLHEATISDKLLPPTIGTQLGDGRLAGGICCMENFMAAVFWEAGTNRTS